MKFFLLTLLFFMTISSSLTVQGGKSRQNRKAQNSKTLSTEANSKTKKKNPKENSRAEATTSNSREVETTQNSGAEATSAANQEALNQYLPRECLKSERNRLSTFSKELAKEPERREQPLSFILLARQGFAYVKNDQGNFETACVFCKSLISGANLKTEQDIKERHNAKCPMVTGVNCGNTMMPTIQEPEKTGEQLWQQHNNLSQTQSLEAIPEERGNSGSSNAANTVSESEDFQAQSGACGPVSNTRSEQPRHSPQQGFNTTQNNNSQPTYTTNNHVSQPVDNSNSRIATSKDPSLPLAEDSNNCLSSTLQGMTLNTQPRGIPSSSSSNAGNAESNNSRGTQGGESASPTSSQNSENTTTSCSTANSNNPRGTQGGESASPTSSQNSENTTTSCSTANSNNSVEHQANEKPTSYDSLRIFTQEPKRPEYAVEAVRLQSFGGWPQDHHLKPADLAKAGYFYTGYSDCARCFYCGGGLRNWEEGDDVWVEHARWFSKCAFIRLMRGQCFIDVTQDLNKEQEIIPRIDVIAEMKYRGQKVDVIDRLEKEPEAIIMEQDPGIALLWARFGFKKDDVFNAIESLQKKDKSLDLVTIYDELREMKVNMATSLDKIIAQSNDGGSVQTGSNQNHEGKNEQCYHEIMQKSQELRAQFRCKVCLEREISVVLLPCGHLLSCLECSFALKDCPVCRDKIKGRVRGMLQ